MNIAVILPYCIALLIMFIIPGPGITTMLGFALGVGFRAAVPMAVGIIAGDLTFLTAVVLGLAVLVKTYEGVFAVLKVLSVFYIFYLAILLWVNEYSFGTVEGRRASPRQAFLTGYIVTMSNPACMIFYISLLPTLVPLNEITFHDYAIMVGVTGGILLITALPYIFFASRVRLLVKDPLTWRLVRRFSALIMASGAVLMAMRVAWE